MEDRQHSINDSVQGAFSSPQNAAVNPHTLWKQVVGFSIGSIIVGFVCGVGVVLPGAFTFLDAWAAGIYKKKNGKSFLNMSPMAWGIVMEGLLILGYPLYLINRNKLKTKDGNTVFWILTIIFGGIFLVFGVIGLIRRIAAM